jgi:uncharacterized protein (UPF0212 family)
MGKKYDADSKSDMNKLKNDIAEYVSKIDLNNPAVKIFNYPCPLCQELIPEVSFGKSICPICHKEIELIPNPIAL